jgi:two-component system phosphate regulon response regulator PhoB
MQRILIVEDSVESQLIAKQAIIKPSVEVDVVENASDAIKILAQQNYHLIILDLHLPDRDGFDLFLELQRSIETRNIPVIFMTGTSDVTEKVTAFSLGAEDYIVKPFHPLEFRARIESKLKKYENQKSRTDFLSFGNLTINTLSHKATLHENGKTTELELTHLEYKLLLHFVHHSETIFTREQLLNSVWSKGVHVSDRTVDVHICELRKKLGKLGRCIESVSGAGYRLSHSPKSKKNVA